jgi:xanthine/CO dehydrogenase XdhC/CoxF family maturation factor
LGPRKRSEKFFEDVQERGIPISDQERKRIFAPAGLDIGAAAPEEIALSIVAEICSQFTGANGMSLKYKEGTIHAV